jgi:hypothetical protein
MKKKISKQNLETTKQKYIVEVHHAMDAATEEYYEYLSNTEHIKKLANLFHVTRSIPQPKSLSKKEVVKIKSKYLKNESVFKALFCMYNQEVGELTIHPEEQEILKRMEEF